MTKVVIYTDFDGTVTKRSGEPTVFSAFYQSLQSKRGFYRDTPMKKAEECQDLFIKKFGEYNESFDWNQIDTDLLMSKDAVKFFHYVLKNEEIKVNIVTKNRDDYILALFRYQGFTENEINNLSFDCSGDKNEAVISDIWQYEVNTVDIYITDDNEHDYNNMKKPTNSWNQDRIHGGNEPVGKFKWDQYLNEIHHTVTQNKSVSDNNTLNEKEIIDKPLSNNNNNNQSNLEWNDLNDDEKSNISLITKPKRSGVTTSDYWVSLNYDLREKLLSYSRNRKNQIDTDTLAAEINTQIDTYCNSREKIEKSYFFKDQDKINILSRKINVLIAANDLLKSGLSPEYLQQKELDNPGWDEEHTTISLVNRVKNIMNIPLNWDDSKDLSVNIM